MLLKPARKTPPIRTLLALLFFTLALFIIAVCVYVAIQERGYPKDMRGNAVASARIPNAVLREINATSQSGGVELRVPSTGLHVPVGALNEVDGVINPPGFTSAYRVRNFGASLDRASEGTVYIVMHSCRGGAICPGNYLIDVKAGAASLQEGADIYVGSLHYRMTGWESVAKPTVSKHDEVWVNKPGRLVLLTCLQNPSQTASKDNMVITADLVKPAAR